MRIENGMLRMSWKKGFLYGNTGANSALIVKINYHYELRSISYKRGLFFHKIDRYLQKWR